MSSAGRAVMYGLPGLSIALTAAVLLGPGRARMAVGVKLWGAPAEGGEALALRIQGARRLLGVDDAAPLAGLTVRATSGGVPLGPWAGDAGPEGIAEAWIAAPDGLRAPLVVRVEQGGAPLFEGELPLGPPPRPPGPPAAPPRLPGAAEGALRMEVEVARGALIAPFRGALRVRVAGADGEPAAGARIEARAAGADLAGAIDGAAIAEADAGGAAELGITPRAHLVELSLTAARDGAAGRWEGNLPVVPGALWLDARRDPARLRLRITSPSPRTRAYLSLVGARGRVLGAVVPLARDAAGFHAGEFVVDRSLPPPVWAVLAGDPYEQGAGTLAWPLDPPGPAAPAAGIALLADGVPGAQAREQARAAGARRAGLLVLGAAAAAEVLLAIALSRRARRRLADHLREASDGDSAGGVPLPAADRARLLGATGGADQALWALALIALIALGFAAVAALTTFG